VIDVVVRWLCNQV